jgi:hypothetical protein
MAGKGMGMGMGMGMGGKNKPDVSLDMNFYNIFKIFTILER